MSVRSASIVAMTASLAACAASSTSIDSASAVSEANAQGQTCSVSANDRAWLERSVVAWHFTSQKITKIGPVDDLTVFFFDDKCALTSFDAMTRKDGAGATYITSPFFDEATLPDGTTVPVAPTSFTKSTNGNAFFVMSLPSVWQTNDVPPGPFGLEKLMTAVLLHEASHVMQSPTYGAMAENLSRRLMLGDDFNDDSIQLRFRGNDEFAASVEQETALLFEAAAASDRSKALPLARQARALMQKRRDRWFTVEDSYLSEAEDVWLSLEGSGQWVGYSYLIDPRGGAVPAEDAMVGFGLRGGRWTQTEGLAIALTLDRLGSDWKRQAFGGSSVTLTSMLDAAIGER